MTAEDRYWQIAETVCTDAEIVVLHLRNDRHLGTRPIAFALGITRAAVRYRLEAADHKIAQALAKETAA